MHFPVIYARHICELPSYTLRPHTANNRMCPVFCQEASSRGLNVSPQPPQRTEPRRDTQTRAKTANNNKPGNPASSKNADGNCKIPRALALHLSFLWFDPAGKKEKEEVEEKEAAATGGKESAGATDRGEDDEDGIA
ncbi:hypothetical protein EVAR_42921_1 [Eumeta japonica]|uniref:Uncharacterized protein n=1 Tax=Eumeta variegata TaxID=151549 RepID=A0A4C1WTU4_EUMVA|nr:hypothetical protein EVAR_42921_1 [Eumeta japonica]